MSDIYYPGIVRLRHMIFRYILAFLLTLASNAMAEKSLLEDRINPLATFAITEPDFLPVDEAYIFSSRIEGNELVIHWDIADGYYLYKNRIQVTSNEPSTRFSDLLWSKPGKEKQDEYFGLVRVFYQDSELRIPVTHSVNGEAEFSITYQGCADAGLCYPPQKRQALFVNQDSSDTGGPSHTASFPNVTGFNSATTNTTPSPSLPMSLWLSLCFAFTGGLILNLMPCVFPVLSLKALKLARATILDRHEHRVQALAYTAGVISLFTGIALIMIILKLGGESIGWGFQLQSPWFVGLMVYVMFLLGLSLIGWLELGTGLMGTGENLADSGGSRGAFFTGALAVLVASPCTAPFMGTALGYAMTLPAYQAILVFVVLGLGMSSPFLLIGFIPAASKLLPKPGAWMQTFKQFLAFPMFLSALWLLWVLGRQTGVTGMSWGLLGLITITFAVWLHKHSHTKQTRGRYLGFSAALVCIVFSLWILGSQPLNQTVRAGSTPNDPFLTLSTERLNRMLKTKKSVFVNITADWCVSCLVNEKVVLSNEPVSSLLASDDVAYLKGDWTNADPSITDYLASFGRNGIPLYVVYQGDKPPRLLSQLLTTDEVMSALQDIN